MLAPSSCGVSWDPACVARLLAGVSGTVPVPCHILKRCLWCCLLRVALSVPTCLSFGVAVWSWRRVCRSHRSLSHTCFPGVSSGPGLERCCGLQTRPVLSPGLPSYGREMLWKDVRAWKKRGAGPDAESARSGVTWAAGRVEGPWPCGGRGAGAWMPGGRGCRQRSKVGERAGQVWGALVAELCSPGLEHQCFSGCDGRSGRRWRLICRGEK